MSAAARPEAGTQILALGILPDRRQCTLVMTAPPPRVARFDAGAADAFLSDAFACAPDDALAEPEIDRRLPEPVRALLRAAALLARHLLRMASVPAFEPEKIEARPGDAGGATRLTFLVPSPEAFPERHVALLYQLCVDLLTRWQRAGCDAAAIPKSMSRLGDAWRDAKRAAGGGKSTLPLLREAYDRGIPFRHCGGGVYRLGEGRHGKLMTKSGLDGDPALSATIAASKTATLGWLARAGLPVPRSIPVSDLAGARAAAAEIGWPVVVKPADRERSTGVTVDVEGDAALRAAYALARKASANVLVEQRVPGICHRLVAHRGRLVFAFSRAPCSVTGDGTQSVEALLAARRDRRARLAPFLRGPELPPRAEAMATLARTGRALADVPAEGERVFLCENDAADRPTTVETVTDALHPENAALVERAARLLRFESLGIDLITDDPTRPWHETGAAISEINYQPQIGGNTARAYIDRIFGGGDGRVPVHYVIGGGPGARAEAEALRARLRDDHPRCALACERRVSGGDGSDRPFAGPDGLGRRVEALLADPTTDAVVALVRTDELLTRGLPTRRVEGRVVTGEPLVRAEDGRTALPEARRRAVIALLAPNGADREGHPSTD